MVKRIRPSFLFLLNLFFLAGSGGDMPTAFAREELQNRPYRQKEKLILTVGVDEGELRGNDDKIIQAGMDYLHGFGGGTLRILPGVYVLNNAVRLHPDVRIVGAGDKTVLKKAASVSSSIVRDMDWFEYAVVVEDANGFAPGCGILLRAQSERGSGVNVFKATVMKVVGNVIYVDRIPRENFWVGRRATVSTLFPLITAEKVDNVTIEKLVLDGNRSENEHIGGNYAGAGFIKQCNKWNFFNVTARNYNGDGYSFQVCDDVHFDNCRAVNNADFGFHPGSGSQRPVFRNCTSSGNGQGIFFCWGVSDGLVENCELIKNRRFGVSLGHRDTGNTIRNCRIEENGWVGVLFREESRFRSAHRNVIENCTIGNNGGQRPGVGIDIRGAVEDVIIRNNVFADSKDSKQKIAVQIGKEAGDIKYSNNNFSNCVTKIKDLRR